LRLTFADIDPEVPAESRDALLAAVRAEHPADYATALHPSVPTSYTPKFSPLIEAEHERIAAKLPKPEGTGMDFSRYEGLEPPPKTSPHSDEEKPEVLRQWRETLQRAYASSTYLSGRLTNLSLLETYGKNAWLIGNSQLEEILKGLEVDLSMAKKELANVEEERRATQEDSVKGEMEALEQSWKNGIRGIVEVQIATEGLKQEILERRRAAVNG
jgi:pre-mRNA-splicing factor SPF27